MCPHLLLKFSENNMNEGKEKLRGIVSSHTFNNVIALQMLLYSN